MVLVGSATTFIAADHPNPDNLSDERSVDG